MLEGKAGGHRDDGYREQARDDLEEGVHRGRKSEPAGSFAGSLGRHFGQPGQLSLVCHLQGCLIFLFFGVRASGHVTLGVRTGAPALA